MIQNQIKALLPEIFYTSYERWPNMQVFFASDNWIIDNKLIYESFSDLLQKNSINSYLNIYLEKKKSRRGIRKIYALPLYKHYKIYYWILSYFFEINREKAINLNRSELSKKAFINELFQYKRSYGLSESEKVDFFNYDLKDFYPKFDLNLYYKYLPPDNKGFLKAIKRYYNKLYNTAGEHFGLLQSSWPSWLLADTFLQCIDKELISCGFKFFREGDSYFFSINDMGSHEQNKFKSILEKYQLNTRESKVLHSRRPSQKMLSFGYSQKEKLLNKAFPIVYYAQKLRASGSGIAGVLVKLDADSINKNKLIQRLLNKYRWESFELYHILRWALKHNLDIGFYNNTLLSIYPTAPWYLKSQIRFYFLLCNETKSLQLLLTQTPLNAIEENDFGQLCKFTNNACFIL